MVQQKKAAAKKPAAHPTYLVMVQAAIVALKERGGSSAQKIRSYIAANYKVDPAKMKAPLRAALKKGVASGALVQASGKGASGKFKLGKTTDSAKKAKAVERRKAAKAKAAAKRKAKREAKKQKAAAKKAATKAKKAAKKSAKKAKKPKKAAKKAKKPAKKAAKKPAKKAAKKPAKKAAKKATKKPAKKAAPKKK
ncbi:histone H1, gonadal-like [Amphiura filiformis]|uniref:histone H1, gonadal-like n=1 Tax=Amphiura filiformis TaxID=82378 RepID=UPI003B21EBBE